MNFFDDASFLALSIDGCVASSHLAEDVFFKVVNAGHQVLSDLDRLDSGDGLVAIIYCQAT